MTILSWLITAVLVFISLVIHEYAHVFAVRYMGAKIDKVGFFPFGMMAKARGLEILDSQERYLVYAAGPLANFTLALWAGATSYLSHVGVAWLDQFAFYNFVLGVFNLTPAMPMDGGRLMWQFLGNRIGILRANRILIRTGIVISYVLVVLGIVQLLLFPYNITLLCAGLFLLKKNKTIAPELQAAFHTALNGKNSPIRARTLPVKEITLHPDTLIKHALERLAPDYFIIFRIEGKKERLREQALIKHIFSKGINGTIGELTLLKL